MITVIEKNMMYSGKDILVQQVNTQGIMGGGLALTVLEHYPHTKKEYQKFIQKRRKKGIEHEDLLGEVVYVDTDNCLVANVFGQVDIATHGDTTQKTVPEKLFEGIQSIKELAERQKLSIAIPTYIGCGLANGNWDEIKEGIERIFEDSDVDVAFYHYR